MKHVDTVLILGGAGLVGLQVAKRLAQDIKPRRIVIASLYRREATEAVEDLRSLFSTTLFVPAWGDIFRNREGDEVTRVESIDGSLATQQEARSRADLIEDREFRRAVFDSVYGDFNNAYKRSQLVNLILEHRPQVVIDAVNTATGLSYQDIFSSANLVQRGIDEARQVAQEGEGGDQAALFKDTEVLLMSQMVPQLVRHIRLAHQAMMEAGTQHYLKIGTTGTGGMGLNIPYTHGEDKPSPVLMSKSAIGFAHTGLLFLMARTPGGPIIKEIKPAAMIGYKDIGVHEVKGARWQRESSPTGSRLVQKQRQPLVIFQGQETPLGDLLDVEPQPDRYTVQKDSSGADRTLRLVCVNTGENGLFAAGEFSAITNLDQMEFVTAEEIAQLVSLEIQGHNTGKDVIQALDSTVLGPTYRAGVIRQLAVQELARLEEVEDIPSVAIGKLGPPQLAKYLYEAYLLKKVFGTLKGVLEKTDGQGHPVSRSPEEVGQDMLEYVQSHDIRDMIVSIGIPILYPNGKTIYRGPTIRIPVYSRKTPRISLEGDALDTYARRGWVDLRPQHMAWWQERFRRMLQSAITPKVKRSSEWATRELYVHETIEIGDVVAWIFSNDEDIQGYRIKR